MSIPDNPETEQLLARARDGDSPAVGQILARHRGRLRQMISVRMDPQMSVRLDPSDVVQETLVIASQRLSDYLQKRPLPLYPWLRQIARDRLVDLHRRHVHATNRTVRREEPLGISDSSALQLADRLLTDSDPLVTRLLRRELLARVQLALGELASADREILILRHLEQLSTAESACILGISETAAKQRHLRAVQRIRRLLVDDLSGET